MIRMLIVSLVLIIGTTALRSQEHPILFKSNPSGDNTVTTHVSVVPIPLPEVMQPRREAVTMFAKPDIADGNVVATVNETELLFEGEDLILRIDPLGTKVERIDTPAPLSADAQQALEECPLWLRDQLLLKLRLLTPRGLDDDFARLITSAAEHLKDEIAFTIANSSLQTLTDSRFSSARDMLVRNAEFIYMVADSLNYVKLVEHGSYAQRDYYTTTTYRIYDSVTQDTIWSEIPRDYYYWYIVHPKLDQEGVYVTDNGSDNSGQRTYGYSWRDFLWNNPDPTHDYQQVNITTSKGTVGTIQRFGDLMKQPTVLWDRRENYLPFNRAFTPGQTALDMLGNWASRALPVDVTLPRAFQPNQVIMKHNGMCNEDAFLVAGACRTALIPLVYLGCHAEDHVFGSVWDNGWHHYEFFRGGLAVNGNQFYGITNMLKRGSYGWTISMVEATRPDGYPFSLTANYADTCTVQLTVTDTLGNPMEGTMVQLYAPAGTGYRPCMHLYTNSSGVVEFGAGAGKRYLANLYHPKYGWSPPDSLRAYYLSQSNFTAGARYNLTVPYPHIRRASDAPAIQPPAVPGTYSVLLTSDGAQVVSGVNTRDGQRSRFYRREADGGGMLSAMLLNSQNYDLRTQGQAFTCLAYAPSMQAGAWATPVPADEVTYLVLRNRAEVNILEEMKVRIDLYDGIVTSIDRPTPERLTNIDVSPHPVTTSCVFRTAEQVRRIEIVDILGHSIAELNSPWVWQPSTSVKAGLYFARVYTASGIHMKKLMLVR